MNKVAIELFSPAKINLFLAVTGRRPDGYHDLLSLVAQVNYGDYLNLELYEGDDEIISNCTQLPVAEENFIMKAIKAFRRKYAFQNGVRVMLNKKIPLGAGLGGGSSNVVAVLRGLNDLLGNPLKEEVLKAIAIKIGSDCRLFFEQHPVILRGRGEIVKDVDKVLYEKLQGQRILIFKPQFSVDTSSAYKSMSADPKLYISSENAESILNKGINKFLVNGLLDELLYNNFENIIFHKHDELRKIIEILRKDFKIICSMSGSGSACFCILKAKDDTSKIKNKLKEVLGNDIFMIETEIL